MYFCIALKIFFNEFLTLELNIHRQIFQHRQCLKVDFDEAAVDPYRHKKKMFSRFEYTRDDKSVQRKKKKQNKKKTNRENCAGLFYCEL